MDSDHLTGKRLSAEPGALWANEQRLACGHLRNSAQCVGPLAHHALKAPDFCLLCYYSQIRSASVHEGTSGLDLPVLRPLRLAPESINVVLVDENLVRRAEDAIGGCETCSDAAELTFDYVLDALIDADPTVTEYLLCRTAKCPLCRGEITEKTLVIPD